MGFLVGFIVFFKWAFLKKPGWFFLGWVFLQQPWLWNHPWIFLFQDLFDQPTSHYAVQIKWSVCHSTSVDLAADWLGSKSTMSMVQGSPLDLVPYVFVIVTACTFHSWDHFFFTFFKTLQTFALGVRFSIRLALE